MQIPDDRYEPISVDEAASRLKVSPSTVRRMIRDGKIAAEREQRPQGEIVRVLWPATSQAPSDATTPSGPAATDLPVALSAALGPLTDALASERAERQKLAQENAELRERVGRAESDAEHTREALDWTEARRAQAEGELERMRARSFWKPWTW
jgi:excisionase family DNA binding protein